MLLADALKFTDWMTLSQTVILFFTGVVVFWYTCETKRLRQLGERQAGIAQQQSEVAVRQADLSERQFHLSEEQAGAATEQLRMAQSAFQDMQNERRRASYPFLLLEMNHSGGDSFTLRITNKGGAIYNVWLESMNQTIRLPKQVHNYLDLEGKMSQQATASFPPPEDWELIVHYFTLLHEKCVGRYFVKKGVFDYQGHE